MTIGPDVSKMSGNMNFLDDSFIEEPVKRRFTQSVWFPWLIVTIILSVLLVIFSPIVFIGSGHRGVSTFFGDTQGELLTEGVHLKYPLLRVHLFDVRTQVHDVSNGAVTEDMQLVTVGVTVNYRLDPAELKSTYENVGREVEAKLIDPAVKEAINAAATEFTAEELVSDRTEFRSSILKEIETRLAESGVIVENVAVISVDFSKTLKEAFTAKAVAEQAAATAVLQNQTAELNRDTAVGLSDSEAEQIRILGEALRGNEVYIQYEIMKKWDGKAPLYLAPTSPVQVNTSQDK